jgi:hypothetical protein
MKYAPSILDKMIAGLVLLIITLAVFGSKI